MPIRTPCDFRIDVNEMQVGWAPWSLLKTSGRPCSNASSNASIQSGRRGHLSVILVDDSRIVLGLRESRLGVVFFADLQGMVEAPIASLRLGLLAATVALFVVVIILALLVRRILIQLATPE